MKKLVSFVALWALFASQFSFQLYGQSCVVEALDISASNASQSGTTGSWTAPPGGLYKVRIIAKGAKGGANGGNGATMSGEFIIAAGQELQSIAGAPGGDNLTSGAGGGGGGGSGTRIANGQLLILAGGGGGGSASNGGGDGVVANNGNGNGGTTNGTSGGGGGFLSAGASSLGLGGGAGYSGVGGERRQSPSHIYRW